MFFMEKLVAKINLAVMWIAGFMIMFMGFSTTADVILRTLLNRPIVWSFDAACYISAAVAFLTGGYGLLTDRHVKVDVVYGRFSPRVRAAVDVCTSFLFFFFCAVLVWIGLKTAMESLKSGARAGGVLNFPLFVPQLLVPVGGLLLGLQGIFHLVKNFEIAAGYKQKREGSG
jgi:TRAP-type mannitol/chloroaromatic compound transport system permease small subunit